jgi:deferrochelatase/peroxidase EfeB
VTVTVGFGASLFGGIEGDDRFQMRSLKPRYLRMMPSFYGDAEGLSPRDTASDLLFAISSDHPYVNVAIARSIAHGYVDPRLAVKEIAQGFSRPDKREFLRFDDGIDNLSNWPDGDLDRLIYIGPRDIEPDWCVGGSYLVYRKIRENLPIWEHLRTEQQEEIIGRHKSSGLPLARQTEPRDPRVPVFPDPKDPRDGALTAHIRKVQPRRNYPDLLGVHDLDRRFLRRPYPYFKGLDSRGEVECGLLFLAFMKSIKQQFEWPVQIWQTNPDFPIPGTGVDALYANGIISTIGGGYYFCPPAPNGKTDFLGSVLFG